jgi:hypothetical protein
MVAYVTVVLLGLIAVVGRRPVRNLDKFDMQAVTLDMRRHRPSMRETTINIIDALRGQQEQLKRLLAQKVLISDAPRIDLSEIEAQVIEIKRLLAEFEKVIQDHLQRNQ